MAYGFDISSMANSATDNNTIDGLLANRRWAKNVTYAIAKTPSPILFLFFLQCVGGWHC